MYKLRPGQSIVQGNEAVIVAATPKVLELRHSLCGNRKICVRTDELSAHISLVKGETVQITQGTYRTKVQVSGKLLYQPENSCGGIPIYSGCNPCEPCPQEDVIFASFNVYTTTQDFTLASCAASATPITHSNCQDFTNLVQIELPYAVYPVTTKSTK